MKKRERHFRHFSSNGDRTLWERRVGKMLSRPFGSWKKPWTGNWILIKSVGEWYGIDGRRQPKHTHTHTQIEAWRTKNPGPFKWAEGQSEAKFGTKKWPPWKEKGAGVRQCQGRHGGRETSTSTSPRSDLCNHWSKYSCNWKSETPNATDPRFD